MMTAFEPDEVDSRVPPKRETTLRNRLILCLKALSTIKVEPILFLVMFGTMLRTVPSQALLQDRACHVHFGYPESMCQNLTKHERIEVQSLANKYHMCHTIISTLPSAVITMLATSWSEKYGRRYPMLIALLGLMLDSIGTLLFALSSTAPLGLYLLSPILSGISGGFMMVLTAAYSYMSEFTPDKSRAIRFAFLEFAFIMAMPLGTEVGGQVLKYRGFVAVIGITASSYLLALIWTAFVFRDVSDNYQQATRKELFRDFISTENIKKCVLTSVKKRHGTIRKQLWLLMAAMFCNFLVFMGITSVGLQHSQVMYDWDATDYSDVSTVSTVVHSVIMILAIHCFTRILRIGDATIGLIGSLSNTADCVLRAVAYEVWIYYYARAAGSFYSCGSIAVRSRLSKLIPKEEQSEIFAMLALFESFTPIIATVVFPPIYNATVRFYPGMVFAVSAVIAFITVQIFWWLSKQPDISYRQIREEEETAKTIYLEERERY